jgi:glycosyltransferase involved in cell wall biosynthesis
VTGAGATAAAGLRLGYLVEAFPAFLVDEVRELRRQGAEIVLFSAFRPAAQADPEADALRSEALYFPPGYRGVLAANLAALLRHPAAYLGLALALLRQRESLRLVVLAAHFARVAAARGLQHLHGTFGTRTATLACAAARLGGVSFSFTTHAYDIFVPNPGLAWKTRHARFMRTISEFNRRYLEGQYAGIDAGKLRVVHLGVDTTRFQPRPGERRTSGPFRILSVANLVPKKGHGQLLAACARLRQAGIALECRIAGEGPQRAALQAEIVALGLQDCVWLLGALARRSVEQELARADAFALACLDARASGQHLDGIPVALMEAMAAGLPVVASQLSGIPELVEDGVSGLLVPERDPEALAGALLRLASDPELRAALGRAARCRVEELFRLEASAARLAELFAAAVP